MSSVVKTEEKTMSTEEKIAGVPEKTVSQKQSEGISLKQNAEDLKKSLILREKAEEEAKVLRKKAAEEAAAAAAETKKLEDEKINPNYKVMLANITKNVGFNFSGTQEDCSIMFNEYHDDICKMQVYSGRVITVNSGSRKLNKSSYIKSFKTIPYLKGEDETVLTIKRVEKNGKISYRLIGETTEDNDREVLIQSHMGKEKLGLNYDDDKEKIIKAYDSIMDKLIKFTENYSTGEFKDKNFKKVRCNKKEIETLLKLIHDNRR